jgi:hypothetical protein
MLVLGRQTPGSENLNLGMLQSHPFLLVMYLNFFSPHKDQPLATDFSLRDGSVNVTCPTVSSGNNYIVVCTYGFLTSHGLLSHPIQCLEIRGMQALRSPSQAQVRAIVQQIHQPERIPVQGIHRLSVPTAHLAPLAGLNGNDTISRIQNPGAMIASTVVSVFTIEYHEPLRNKN